MTFPAGASISNVTISDVELGATTLAALETTELGATSLAALETVSLSTTDASEIHSTAYEASHVIKATAGKLLGFSGYNSGPAQFIHIYNSATLPADTAVPIITIKIAATDNFSWDSGGKPYPFAAGMVISNSSTGPTKTIGAADCWFNVLFE